MLLLALLSVIQNYCCECTITSRKMNKKNEIPPVTLACLSEKLIAGQEVKEASCAPEVRFPPHYLEEFLHSTSSWKGCDAIRGHFYLFKDLICARNS